MLEPVNKKVRNYKNFKPVIIRKKHNNNGSESVNVVANGSESVNIVAIGLDNIGNSCFMNSSLQVLFGLYPFMLDVQNLQGALQKTSFSHEDAYFNIREY